jgi:hypothetical protein
VMAVSKAQPHDDTVMFISSHVLYQFGRRMCINLAASDISLLLARRLEVHPRHGLDYLPRPRSANASNISVSARHAAAKSPR